MSIKIIVSDLSSGHANAVIQGLSLGYGSDLSANCEVNMNGLSSALARAVEVGAVAVIRSTTGVFNYTSLAKGYYDNHGIMTVMPLGSNSFIHLDYLSSIPVIVTTGAGDEEERNNTGYGAGLEFWDWDLIQTDPPSSDQSSTSNGVILGKLLKIKEDLDCSWWEARYRARMTCPRLEPNREDSPHDLYNGYGRIDIDAAKAFSGDIIEDPYYTEPEPEKANPPVINCNGTYPINVSGITFIPDKSSGSYRYKFDDGDWTEISGTTIPDTILNKGSHIISIQEYWNGVWSESATEQFKVGKMSYVKQIAEAIKLLEENGLINGKLQLGTGSRAIDNSIAVGHYCLTGVRPIIPGFGGFQDLLLGQGNADYFTLNGDYQSYFEVGDEIMLTDMQDVQEIHVVASVGYSSDITTITLEDSSTLLEDEEVNCIYLLKEPPSQKERGIALGQYCAANGEGSLAMGFNCLAEAYYSIAIGSGAAAERNNQIAFSSGSYTPGRSQKCEITEYSVTGHSTPKTIALPSRRTTSSEDVSTQSLTKAHAFKITVLAKNITDSTSASWFIEGLYLNRDNGTGGWNEARKDFATDDGGAIFASGSVVVSGEYDPDDCGFSVTVTGADSKTIRWFVHWEWIETY